MSVFFSNVLFYIAVSNRKRSVDCAGEHGSPQTVVERGSLGISVRTAPEGSDPQWSRAFLGLCGRVCPLCHGWPASTGALQILHNN